MDSHGRTFHDVDPELSRGHARRYMERRAALGSHRPSVQWLWAVAGAYDALVRGAVPEARARLALLMVAGEQSCMDGGSWLMARELLLEEEPPFGAIAARGTEGKERARPTTCDPRWGEVAHARLRELDEWRERRKRLQPPGLEKQTGQQQQQQQHQQGDGNDERSRRAQAKAKAVARLAALEAEKAKGAQKGAGTQ